MNESLQYIYYTWKKVILWLTNHYVNNENTVALFYVFIAIAFISLFIRYALPRGGK